MSLQPLYDVKARLEQTAIAGVGLLGEDFRLRRAAESFKPLAAASPVFGRIDAGLDKLLSATPGEQTGLLLDLLALVDAVAYTQAKTGGTGELFPLTGGPGQYQELSYSRLHPLLTALTGTGGGRMGQLKDTWENHPEFFSDYRVLSALIAGLGDSYSDLAELNEFILKEQGAWIVPFLKEGFDPSGKKEMARRVEVVSALEGAAATPWLLEVLPLAKKDVRAAVLAALGRTRKTSPFCWTCPRPSGGPTGRLSSELWPSRMGRRFARSGPPSSPKPKPLSPSCRPPKRTGQPLWWPRA